MPGELIVSLPPAASHRAGRGYLSSRGCRNLRRLGRSNAYRVEIPPGKTVEGFTEALAREGRCGEVTPNYIGRGGDLGEAYLPGDTHFPLQWHLEQESDRDIDAPEGWEITRGSGEVTVAILDTGIDSDHPEFAGRILAGWDFVNDDPDPEDDHSHGTKVAGILAANAGNAFGTAGVDHACRVLPVKVLNERNKGTLSDLIEGIEFAVEMGADVISMSLIDYAGTQALRNALQAAREKGIILVACSGNGGIGNADVSWPGASPDVITVGLTGQNDERPSYSGTGQALDVVAPGSGIVTVRWGSDRDEYVLFSGCSAATPVAAGIACLVKAVDPEITPEEALEAIRAGAQDEVGFPDEDTPGWDPYYGWGRVNLQRTLSYISHPAFVRGDPNQDERTNLADAIAILLFVLGGATADCEDALDIDDGGSVGLSDVLRLLVYIFADGAPPAAPFPGCGPDPTADVLGCRRYGCPGE